MSDQHDPTTVVRGAFAQFWEAARGAATGDGPREGGADQIRSALSRLVDLQMEVAQRVVAAQIDFLAERLEPRRSSIDPADRIEIKGEPGTVVSATIWLHNITAAALALVVFRAGDLAAASGRRLPHRVVSFDPAAIQAVDADGVLATTIAVVLPRDVEPDVYHGFIFVADREDVAGHLVVTVTDVDGDD